MRRGSHSWFGTGLALGATALATLALSVSCSPADNGRDERVVSGGSGAATGAGGSQGAGATTGAGGLLTGSGGVLTSGTGGTGAGGGEQCATVSSDATLMREPIDVILALDNSGSMAEELEAVEQNINQNFAAILEESGVDYRVILVSRYRVETRAESGESSTSICVSAPLSGAAECPAEEIDCGDSTDPDCVEGPVFSARFYHYSTKVESDDAFDKLLATYSYPFESDCRSLCKNGGASYSADDVGEKFDNAPEGWSAWLRPGAKKVFLVMTDDSEDLLPAEFVDALTQKGPEHFGTVEAPNFVFHSIVGIAPKPDPRDPWLPTDAVEMGECTGNSNSVASAGQTYQELSIQTGGLRFPMCEFQYFDTVFNTIANDVVVTAEVACDFAIPEPPAGHDMIELDNVAVTHERTDGTTGTFGQAATTADCGSDAFYIDADANRITLCPEACEVVRQDAGSNVEVNFTCESQIIVR